MKFPFPPHKNQSARKIPGAGAFNVDCLDDGNGANGGRDWLTAAATDGATARCRRSYQQMAETAALNGFNRILGELNNDDNTAYKGYYLTRPSRRY